MALHKNVALKAGHMVIFLHEKVILLHPTSRKSQSVPVAAACRGLTLCLGIERTAASQELRRKGDSI